MPAKKKSKKYKSDMKDAPPKQSLKELVEIPVDRRKPVAAALLGEDKLPDREIAAIVGVSRRALANWKTDPEFQVMVQRSAEDFNKQFLKKGLAQREKRLAVLNDIHGRLMTSVKERGNDPSMANVPGGETGMVARTYRGVGKGRSFRLLEEYKIDTPVVKALLEIHDSVREELGENKQRFEMTGPDGEPLQPPHITVQFIKVEKVARHDTDGGVALTIDAERQEEEIPDAEPERQLEEATS